MQHRVKVVSLFTILVVAFFSSTLCGQLSFPDPPAPGELLHDNAGLLSTQDQGLIQQIQFKSYHDFDTPIVVVTVLSLNQYGATGEPIEFVAKQLFNHWQIGKRNELNRLINQGILLLVSTGDRQARIELGADWGRAWDRHCNMIMQEDIVPNFKNGDFSLGIREGVDQLAVMAKAGPQGEVTKRSSIISSLKKPMIEGINPMPRWIGWGMMLGGIMIMISGLFVPEEFQQLVFVCGAALVLFGILSWFLVILLGIFLGRNSDGGRSSWTGGGGFSSGGFSGGGGATGSW